MSSERAVPFASKPPEGWDDHVEVMRGTRMFLLQTKGPTRFVVRGEDSDRKFNVLVGSRARCSCGIPLCLHHLFVMLKVLKVPPTNPLAWQTALIDAEVDCILGDGVGGGVFGRLRKNGAAPPLGQRHDFLRRGAGRTSAAGGGSSSTSKGVGDDDSEGGDGGADGGGTTRRLAIVPGEVCPVCQEEMEDEGDGGEVGGGRGLEMERRLTYCRDGCGNNMHARCMLMYAEHRRSSGDKPCCPLCRVDWGFAAVRALKDVALRLHGPDGKRGGRPGKGGGSDRSGGAAAAAASTRAVLAPVTCRSCSVKVQAAFFRCLVCGPAGSWDLCRRCYAMTVVRKSSNGGSSCTPVGRRRHLFVQGEAAIDPPEWKPAEPPGNTRQRGGARGSGAAPRGNPAVGGVLLLQEREITTADFELLLTLDASPVAPLHEHLLRALPPCDATEASSAAAAGGLSLPQTSALLARQRPGASLEPLTSMPRRLQGQSSPSSSPGNESGGDPLVPDSLSLQSLGTRPTDSDHDGYDTEHPSLRARRDSEGCPLTGSGPLSQPARRTMVVAELMSPPLDASSQSLSGLVAAAALTRHAAAAVTASDPVPDAASATAPQATPAPARAPEAEGRRDAPVYAAVGVPAGSRECPTVPLSYSDEAAPISGSFAAQPISCSCCSEIGNTGSEVGRGGDNNALNPHRNAGALLAGRRHASSSSASASSASSQSMRRLPCGHSAHDACLIPLILESVGRGDPSRCRCPLDSCPIFPVLSRRRRRARRSRPGSDDGASTAAASAAAASAARHGHRDGTRSAPSPTASFARRVGDSVDRHARATAAREAFRRSAAGCGGGGAADALGIMLVGSGLGHPTSHPPPPPPAGAVRSAARVRVRERGRTNWGVSVREKGAVKRRTVGIGREERKAVGEVDNDREAGVGSDAQEVGGAGHRQVASIGDSVPGSGALVCGEGILNGARGESLARGEPPVDGAGSRALSPRRRGRRFPCVVRGSTIGTGAGADGGEGCTDGRQGRVVSSGGLAGDGNGARSTGTIEGLTLTSFPVASCIK